MLVQGNETGINARYTGVEGVSQAAMGEEHSRESKPQINTFRWEDCVHGVGVFTGHQGVLSGYSARSRGEESLEMRLER